MKKLFLGFTGFAVIGLAPAAVHASDLMVAAAMQRCTTNEECTLITNSCADNCGFVPVNKMNLQSLQATYQQRCGKSMEANPQCNMNPPISATCINSRCTIDYAYANNADQKDYQSGAYPVPEQPVPSQAPASAAPADDRHGFTAYEMPQDNIRQKSLGTIYVPPSAPVSGGNYVPVAPTTPQTAPQAAPAPAPAAAAPTYAPTTQTHATPPVVTTPPSSAPAAAASPTPAPAAVPVPAPTPVPTATTTPRPIATPENPIPSSATDAIPEPRVPQEEPMLRGVSPDTGNPNAPIPPSEYKSQTFVPPPGSTIPVAPEDPGAKPPEGTVLLPPVPRGPDEAPSFGTSQTVKKKYN